MQIRPTAFTIGLIIYSFIALFLVYTEFGIDSLQAQLLLKANNHEDYSDIAKEIFDLRDQQEKSQLNDNSRSEYIKRINDLQKFIISQTKTITDFDEKLVKHLLDKVTVYESKLVFEFKSGISITIDK